MLELLTGTGLAVSAGLNAYIPLLLIGLAARFTDLVTLPPGWVWLENEWVLGIVALLLVIEIVADKIPAVDSVNDWIQTIVRPTSGGLVFGSGATSQTVAVTDPSSFFSSNQWVPIVAGVVVALVVHLLKMSARPAINVMTAGIGAPIVSTAEDLGSVVLSVFAIVIPILVVVGIAALVWGAWWLITRVRRRKRGLVAEEQSPAPPIPPVPRPLR